MKTHRTLKQFLMLCIALVLLPGLVQAGIEWENLRELKLKNQALDVTASFDGKLIFTLTPGEILVYATDTDTFLEPIPVNRSFTRIAYANDEKLIVAAADPAKLSVIKFDQVYTINISNRPATGAQKPKVTLVVFDDYQ